jgi:hypothetical protein
MWDYEIIFGTTTSFGIVRDRHEKPYMREKAAAVLKVAGPPEEEGQSARQVARSGLLRKRSSKAVRGWIHTYKEEGIEGFVVEEARVHDGCRLGEKPLDARAASEAAWREGSGHLNVQDRRWNLTDAESARRDPHARRRIRAEPRRAVRSEARFYRGRSHAKRN